MFKCLVSNCGSGEYAAVVEIYNHYVENTAATFDTARFSVGERAPWFAQFQSTGPYQLLVGKIDDAVVGYAYSARYKSRPAYDVSVETTVYVAPEELGRGIGTQLYANLLDRLSGSGLHGAYAGVTLPNEASVRLHRRLGFKDIGVETEVGFKFSKYWSVARFERRL
ncbi:MAG: N-acetyltransferase family protein [Pseudomonadota bacterium]